MRRWFDKTDVRNVQKMYALLALHKFCFHGDEAGLILGHISKKFYAKKCREIKFSGPSFYPKDISLKTVFIGVTTTKICSPINFYEQVFRQEFFFTLNFAYRIEVEKSHSVQIISLLVKIKTEKNQKLTLKVQLYYINRFS